MTLTQHTRTFISFLSACKNISSSCKMFTMHQEDPLQVRPHRASASNMCGGLRTLRPRPDFVVCVHTYDDGS